MKTVLLICSFLLLACSFLIAQNDDYVIDVNDKKSYGVVILSTPAINSTIIKFKDNQTGTTRQYRTDEIKCWYKAGHLYETKHYVVSAQKTFSVFMKRLTPEGGKANLFEYYNTNGDVGYTQTFLEKDEEMVEINFGAFKKQMLTLFGDNEELAQKISNNEYKKKDLLTIIEEYNAWREYLWKN